MDASSPQLWITRPNPDGEAMAQLARAQAIVPWQMPVLDIFWMSPTRQAMRALATAEVVIVTSRHALTSLDKAGVALPKTVAWLAVGAATGQALEQRGVHAVVPQKTDSEGLLAEPLLADIRGRSVVLLKGQGGRTILTSQLTQQGAQVCEVPLYRRVCKAVDVGMITTFMKQADPIVSVASAETLSCALKAVPTALRPLLLTFPLVVMSERVAQFARQHGWKGSIYVATEASSQGLMDAVNACIASTSRRL